MHFPMLLGLSFSHPSCCYFLHLSLPLLFSHAFKPSLLLALWLSPINCSLCPAPHHQFLSSPSLHLFLHNSLSRFPGLPAPGSSGFMELSLDTLSHHDNHLHKDYHIDRKIALPLEAPALIRHTFPCSVTQPLATVNVSKDQEPRSDRKYSRKKVKNWKRIYIGGLNGQEWMLACKAIWFTG